MNITLAVDRDKLARAHWKFLGIRLNRSPTLVALLAFSLWWSVSIFAAPYMAPPGTIEGLHGKSNIVDFWPLWNNISAYPRAIYVIGDVNCHQYSERTIYLNGNEMPVCARDVTIFVFLSVGLAAALAAKPDASIAKAILNLFPRKVRKSVLHFKEGPTWFAAWLLILCMVPTAIDGFSQLLFPYESSNALRLFTGAPLGFVGGFYLGVMITSVGAMDAQREKHEKILQKARAQQAACPTAPGAGTVESGLEQNGAKPDGRR